MTVLRKSRRPRLNCFCEPAYPLEPCEVVIERYPRKKCHFTRKKAALTEAIKPFSKLFDRTPNS